MDTYQVPIEKQVEKLYVAAGLASILLDGSYVAAGLIHCLAKTPPKVMYPTNLHSFQ